MKKIFPLIGLLFICQEAPVLAVTQITDSLYVKQGAKITRLYTDSAALRTMTLSGSPIGTPGDSCMFLNLGVPVHCTKAQVLAWLGSSGITSINTGTAAAHTIVGEQGLQVLDSGTNLYKHVIIPATGYIIPTGSNMRVDSTTLADSAADAGKWGGNVYGGPYLGIHATADSAIAADRARKLATTRTIGKSTTFDGTANIVPDSAVSVVQATQLTTARTIGNTSFNGTANIIPDTCNKANRARYADSSGATHKADTSISSHQSAQLTTAVNIGNVSFNGTAAIIPDTANKANRARYSDSTGKIPDTVHIRLGLSANNINVSNVQTTNLNGTAIGSAYSVVGADQSGAAAARQAAYTNLTSIGSLTNTSGWLHNNGSGTFAYSTPSYSDVGADQSGAAAARQAAYANLTSIGSLANASGWLNNNGSGGFAYSTPPGTWASNFGTTVGTICQGNDSRLSDSRAPNGSASGDLTGSYPGPTVAHTNTSTLLYGDSLNVHGTIIQKNGNVSLGTASPGNQLSVINSTSTFPNALVAFELTNAGATNGLLYLSHAGPGYILDLVRGGASSPASGDWIHWNDASYGPSSGGIKAGGSWAWDTQLYGDQGLSLSGNGYSAASPSMVITTGGNVGIGTTNPEGKLSIVATTRDGISYTGPYNDPYAVGDISMSASGGNVGGVTNWVQSFRTDTYGAGAGSLVFYHNPGSAWVMGLKPNNDVVFNGNVGIGTTNPDSQFTTSAGAHIGGGLLVGGAATIENNIVLGDYGGIPGFYMKSDNLSIGSQTGGLYGQITSNGWSIQSEITAPSMNVSGNDTAVNFYGTFNGTGSFGSCSISSANINHGSVQTDYLILKQSIEDSVYISGNATTISLNTGGGGLPYPVYSVSSASLITIGFTNIPGTSNPHHCYEFIVANIGSSSVNLTLTGGTAGLAGGTTARILCINGGIYMEH